MRDFRRAYNAVFFVVVFHFCIITPRTKVCALYRTLLSCYANLIRSDLFIYSSRRSVIVFPYKIILSNSRHERKTTCERIKNDY